MGSMEWEDVEFRLAEYRVGFERLANLIEDRPSSLDAWGESVQTVGPEASRLTRSISEYATGLFTSKIRQLDASQHPVIAPAWTTIKEIHARNGAKPAHAHAANLPHPAARNMLTFGIAALDFDDRNTAVRTDATTSALDVGFDTQRLGDCPGETSKRKRSTLDTLVDAGIDNALLQRILTSAQESKFEDALTTVLDCSSTNVRFVGAALVDFVITEKTQLALNRHDFGEARQRASACNNSHISALLDCRITERQLDAGQYPAVADIKNVDTRYERSLARLQKVDPDKARDFEAQKELVLAVIETVDTWRAEAAASGRALTDTDLVQRMWIESGASDAPKHIVEGPMILNVLTRGKANERGLNLGLDL
jgi:hypothetical protein